MVLWSARFAALLLAVALRRVSVLTLAIDGLCSTNGIKPRVFMLLKPPPPSFSAVGASYSPRLGVVSLFLSKSDNGPCVACDAKRDISRPARNSSNIRSVESINNCTRGKRPRRWQGRIPDPLHMLQGTWRRITHIGHGICLMNRPEHICVHSRLAQSPSQEVSLQNFATLFTHNQNPSSNFSFFPNKSIMYDCDISEIVQLTHTASPPHSEHLVMPNPAHRGHGLRARRRTNKLVRSFLCDMRVTIFVISIPPKRPPNATPGTSDNRRVFIDSNAMMFSFSFPTDDSNIHKNVWSGKNWISEKRQRRNLMIFTVVYVGDKYSRFQVTDYFSTWGKTRDFYLCPNLPSHCMDWTALKSQTQVTGDLENIKFWNQFEDFWQTAVKLQKSPRFLCPYVL